MKNHEKKEFIETLINRHTKFYERSGQPMPPAIFEKICFLYDELATVDALIQQEQAEYQEKLAARRAKRQQKQQETA